MPDPKEVAAQKAVQYVQDGMTLGLGTGTTAVHAIRAIGARIVQEGIRVRGVPTSNASRLLAESLGISLIDLSNAGKIDITIDGADEIDPALHLIKGGGGALMREKLVASASDTVIIIGDNSKWKPILGAFPLPVTVIPFGWKTTRTRTRLERFGAEITVRKDLDAPEQPFVTDDGLYILDLHFGAIPDPPALESELKCIVGVAEVGLFVGLATRVIFGFPDGHTEEIVAAR